MIALGAGQIVGGIPGPPGADGTGGGGSGDVAGQASSIDGELALFSGTGGKTIKRATGSGYVKAASGVYSTAATVSADDVVDGSTNKAYTAAEKTKLAGVSGTNTGDQTSVTGNAGTATKLATARNINGHAFDGTANITLTPDDFTDATTNKVFTAAEKIKLDALNPGRTSTVSSGTTLVLTATSTQIQVITGSATQLITLPTTSVTAGMQWLVENASTGVTTVQSSGANTVLTLAPGTSAVVTAAINTPTAAADWDFQYGGVVVASGKALTVSNSLTFVGTDGTTMTFPSSSDTVVTAGTLPVRALGGLLAPCDWALNGETVTIVSGSLTQISGTTVNGGSPAVGDRILSFCAPAASGASTGFTFTTQPANGIYVVTNNTTNLTVTRAPDAQGAFNPVGLGVLLKNASWPSGGVLFWVTLPTSGAFTWGTTALQFNYSGGYASRMSTLNVDGGGGLNTWNGTATSTLKQFNGAATAFTTAGPGAVLWGDGEQFCTLTTAYTLASQTAAQKLFNTSTNGAVTLPIGTYIFEALVSLSSLSATNSNFGFALGGTATIAAQLWRSEANCGTLATAAAASSTVNTAANTALVTGSPTATTGWAKITGKIRVSAAGTVIPQISLNTAAAAVVGVDSYFRVHSMGLNTVTNFGTWT